MDRLMSTLGKLDLVGIVAVSVTALVFFAAEVGEAAGWVDGSSARSTPVATTSTNCARPS
jgi:hypothetical protein